MSFNLKRRRDNTVTTAAPASSSHSNNAKMHPRNIYKHNPPDFQLLADLYPAFANHLRWKKDKPTLDWNNPEALIELTKALLHKDFGVTIELPADQLCPTVTSRLNYILWLEDLLEAPQVLSSPDYRPSKKLKSITSTQKHPESPIVGIDIGTGASCIYPLLGVAMNGWHFVATDIDETSLRWATENVARNQWQDYITLRHVTDGTILKSLFPPKSTMCDSKDASLEERGFYHFCMCNPPFFDSTEEKIENPHRALCQATKGELATSGGEFALVSQLVEESLVLRESVQWYTSLVGRKCNLKKIRDLLRSKGIRNVRTTTFYQGYTTRWAVGWSFHRSEEDIKRHSIEVLAGKNELTVSVSSTTAKLLLSNIEDVLRSHNIAWNTVPDQPFHYRASIYDNNNWLRTLHFGDYTDGQEDDAEDVEDAEGEANKIAQAVQIGPIMPPTLVFSFSIDIYQTNSNQSEYTIKFTHTNGSNTSALPFLLYDFKSALYL